MLNLPISALLMAQGPLFCPWRRGGRACGGGRRRQCRSGQGGRHVAGARAPARPPPSGKVPGAGGGRAGRGHTKVAAAGPGSRRAAVRAAPSRGDGLRPAFEEATPGGSSPHGSRAGTDATPRLDVTAAAAPCLPPAPSHPPHTPQRRIF